MALRGATSLITTAVRAGLAEHDHVGHRLGRLTSSQGRQFTVGELGQPATAMLVLLEITAHYL